MSKAWGGGSMSLLPLVPGRPATGGCRSNRPGLFAAARVYACLLSVAGFCHPHLCQLSNFTSSKLHAPKLHAKLHTPGSKKSVDMSRYQTLSDEQKARIAAVLAQVGCIH